MSTYRLENLFHPRHVAIVGASPRPGALGGIVMRGLLDAGFSGSCFAINPKHQTVLGQPCYGSLRAAPVAPDLVVVATPAATVPAVISDAIAAGAKTAVILTAGIGQGEGSAASEIAAMVRQAGLRIVGPNCLGILSPRAKLNASFAVRLPQPGPLALISQSGAIATGIVEWGIQRQIGFSGIVSLGDALDVDFADCLDYFGQDSITKAILLYVEGIQDARKFMSAARKAARVKPVVVLKAGRRNEGARAAATHTGALAGADNVYDAALRRAGCLRVMDLDEMFSAANVLATQGMMAGERLGIVTNGGGLGVLAVDMLMDSGGKLATLTPQTMARLDEALPATWSRANPVDIIGDAPPSRYAAAVDSLIDDPGNDALLIMNCPTAITPPHEAAAAVIERIAAARADRGWSRPVVSVWLGSDASQLAIFQRARIAAYETEVAAIHGIRQLIRVHRQRAALLQPPADPVVRIVPNRAQVEAILADAVRGQQRWLDPMDVSAVLSAYGISATPIQLAHNADEAVSHAQTCFRQGYACAIKIHSRDIIHKSDVDGVRLGVAGEAAVRAATEDILARARRLKPDADIAGVTIQPMIVRPHARELIVGVATDPTFGPVILFGHGGTAVEVINDKALSLLPLDLTQARSLMAETRVARLLAGYRNIAAADADAVADMLVRISRLIEDNPEIVALDLNPVLADDTGVIALDARIEIAPLASGDRAHMASDRFAIRPYPRHLEAEVRLRDGRTLHVRPLRPADQALLTAMLQRCDDDDLRMRFFAVIRSLDPVLIARLTQLDYAREMALIAIDPASGDCLGVVRLHGDANRETGEYAILVRSDAQGRGIGYDLMSRIIAFARAEGYRSIYGAVLAANHAMLRMTTQLGFQTMDSADDPDVVTVRLELGAKAQR
ncbi:MAG: GNAT family N-acetyltransferase [Beijerinckiaceae bacterium]